MIEDVCFLNGIYKITKISHIFEKYGSFIFFLCILRRLRELNLSKEKWGNNFI